MEVTRFIGDGPIRRHGRRIGRVLHLPFTATGRGIRRATHAHGAGESGLGKLIELHAVNSAGDMLITVALASTVFFSVPTAEARGRVALYLAITMAPFTLLAPIVGPLLDRLPHGRRAAMASAMLTRAVLALTMAGAVAGGGLELYPAALGVLVASKSYGVVRSAVVPRLLPPRFSLVKANSRVTLAGLLATGLAAPIGAGLHQIGPSWPLYGACAVFVGGGFLSFTLPHKVDSAKGEGKVQLTSGEHHLHLPKPAHSTSDTSDTSDKTSDKTSDTSNTAEKTDKTDKVGDKAPRRVGLRNVSPSVLHALEACSSLKALSGFLTFFLAFLLREHPLGGLSPEISLGVAAVAAGGGNALGTAIGAWLRGRGPERIIAVVLTSALGVLIVSAALYSAVMVAVVAATAGFALALAKQSLDALIQRDVPERVRTSAFSRSETTLQLAWVIGGAVGIVLPLSGALGMAVAGAMIALGVAASVRGLLAAARQGATHPRVA
ncbi:putative integral membrane protein [Streptomyces bingchenggensis BCW-1]|uniref:Putative integral membrane protein n=1 Tax=Streptomyces bingchenggensis (strain BCW-1) TaxID=749414 RepID=D7C1D2_STRBB|nr:MULTISPECIES: MFS transporter [Streptomyces]ADI08033.1 putative integral membrane protein [Streptomyces bingchenggensis BCW-1]